MKTILVLLLSLLCTQILYAQVDWGNYSHTFPAGTMDHPSTLGLIIAVPKDNDSFRDADNDEAVYKLLATDSSLDSAFRRIGPATLAYRSTFDTAKAYIVLHGVSPRNADAYEFRVKDYPSNRVLVNWRTVTEFTAFTQTSDKLPKMGYLGGYKAPFGHTLLISVRTKNSHQILTSALITWALIKPKITQVYTSETLDAFFRKLQYPWARDRNPAQARQTLDSLPATNQNLVLLLNAKIYNKEQVQYEVSRDDRIIRPWASNEYDNSFIWLKDFAPGRYQLSIRYAVQPQRVKTYHFVIEPAWYQTNRFKLMAGIIVVVFLSALIFLVLFIGQKQRNRRELANKTKVQLELKSIQAQLNPHFVFNALGSIQGLINKQDIEGANNYLTTFARLMRESLTNSNKAEVALREEIQSLETYLSLEQLRFGFQYQLVVSEAINPYTTSIPSLLMQPLVENAVKHGVSVLQQTGLIDIRFDRVGDTMVVQIDDNGKGISANESTSGFGLKLTRDRINLLNELNPAQLIRIDITPRQPGGTQVQLHFTHWFV